MAADGAVSGQGWAGVVSAALGALGVLVASVLNVRYNRYRTDQAAKVKQASLEDQHELNQFQAVVKAGEDIRREMREEYEGMKKEFSEYRDEAEKSYQELLGRYRKLRDAYDAQEEECRRWARENKRLLEENADLRLRLGLTPLNPPEATP